MKNFWKKLKTPARGGQAILALAPMAGFTDSAFRLICKEYGADVTYSEMANVSALYYNPQKTLDLIKFTSEERPYVIQLFGNNPEHFAFAAKLVNSLPLEKGDREGFEKFCDINKLSKSPRKLLIRNFPLFQRGKLLRPDGIDINFGCPAPKVFKQGSGCALMRDKKLSQEIITAVCENTKLPVSIKIRAGIHPVKSPRSGDAKCVFNRVKHITALDFIENIKDLPFFAVMIHGRTYEGGFSGAVDFKIAEKIKKIIPDKIVLANGGINTPEEAAEILKKYPTLDGLGIARGALGKPFIFNEIKSLLKSCLCDPPSGGEAISRKNGKRLPRSLHSLAMTTNYNFIKIKHIVIKHAELVWKEKKKAGIIELRKHLGWYVRNFPGASELRQKLVQVESLKEIKDILKN